MSEVKVKLKTVFEVDGVKYAARRPSLKDQDAGQEAYNRAFRRAVDSEAILRAKLGEVLRRQRLWDDEKQAQRDRIEGEIASAEKSLARGYRLEGQKKVALKMSEAKAEAIRIRQLRRELNELLSPSNDMDSMTAESQAENARFNFYCGRCIVHEEGERAGKPVFKDAEEYQEKAESAVAFEGATKLMALVYNSGDDWRARLPENKFLIKYGFADAKGRLIDKEGRLVSEDGRLIDENGRYVNEKGELVNRDGERIDEEGRFVCDEPMEFVDDMGVAEKAKEKEQKPEILPEPNFEPNFEPKPVLEVEAEIKRG